MSIWGFHPLILDCGLILHIWWDQCASKQAKSWLTSAALTWSHNANEIDWQKAVSGQIGPSWSLSISPDQKMDGHKTAEFSAVAAERSIKKVLWGECDFLYLSQGLARCSSGFLPCYNFLCCGTIRCGNCLSTFRDVKNGEIYLNVFSLGATWFAVILSLVFTPLPVSTNTVLGDTWLFSSDAVCYLAKFRGRNVQCRKWGLDELSAS